MRSFKDLLSFFILFIIFSSSSLLLAAPRILWDESGIGLRQGYHIEWQRAGAIDAEGNVCYVWSDCRNSERDVYAQLVSPDGTRLWEEGGKLVVSAEVRQEDPDIISDLEGGFIVSWVDYRTDSLGDVWVQALDSEGDQRWEPQGVPVCVIDTAFSLTLHTMPDYQGGGIIVWNDNRFGDDGDLYAHHILSSGELDPNWPENGLRLAGGSGGQGGPGQQTVDSDGQGGVWVGWTDTRISGNPDIYLQHVDVDGNLMWPDTVGLPICTNAFDQVGVKLAPDGSGGVFLVWVDKRNYFENHEDLYVQRVNANGEISFPQNGAPLVNGFEIQHNPRIVYDGQGGAIIIWEDHRNLVYENDLYAQRIDTLGNFPWGTDDVLVCGASGDQLGARLSSDQNGGAIVAWRDERFGVYPEGDIFAQRLNSSGGTVWTPDGMAVCTELYLQEAPLVRARSDGSSTIAWGDFRLGSVGIYLQVLTEQGGEVLTPGGEQVVWGIDGNSNHARIMKISEAENKYMAVWQDGRMNHIGNLIYQQVFDFDGNVYFPASGKPAAVQYENMVSEMAGGQESPEITTDGAGGAIICWKDLRYINGSDQIYAQRLDGEGNILWADSSGVRIYPTAISQQNNHICSDGNGGAYIAWSGYFIEGMTWILNAHVAHIDGNGVILGSMEITHSADDEEVWGIVPDDSGGAYVYWKGGDWEDYNIYAARIIPPCDTLWTRAVCDFPGYQESPRAYPYDDGGLVAVWKDYRSGNNYDIYAQRMNRSGEIMWDDGGVLVVDEASGLDQELGDLVVDSEGNVFVVWQDIRNGFNYDLYMQKLNGATGDTMFQASGVPVSVVDDGDQSSPVIILDELDGPHVCWQDYRNVSADIYASYFDSEGAHHGGWIQDGDNICNFNNSQLSPQLTDDYYSGAISVWEDLRSSGKSQIFNIYMQHWNDDTQGIEGRADDQPTDFTLSQNFPNPFNPETQIRFNLSKPGNVKLMIFNALGQRVVVLEDGCLSAGPHTAVWDGKNFSGGAAASGIYYYRLELEGKTRVMKMIMLK